MPWVELPSGEKKKVACGPCIRGHRSTACNHTDRMLLEVRKPGRPLSTCPHPAGKCSCERLVLNYTIPRASECACPSEGSAPAAAVAVSAATSSASPANKVTKTKHKKSLSTRNPVALEKAIQDTENIEQQYTITPSKSCCSRKPPTSTPSSSNAATPPSANGHDSPTGAVEVDPGSNAGAGPSRSTSTPDEKPLLVQIERNITSGNSVNGWNYASFISTSSIPSATTTAPNSKDSCCKGKSNETIGQPSAPEPKLSSSSLTPTSSSQQALHNQRPSTVGSSVKSSHESPGVNHQYPGFNDQAQFGPQVHNSASSSTMPGNTAGFVTTDSIFNAYSTPFLNYLPQGAGHGQISPISNGGITRLQNTFQHDCTCGDSCACLGCAAHPRNATTMKYIREITDFMENEPYYDSSSSIYNGQHGQYQAGYTVQSPPNTALAGGSHATPGFGSISYHQPYFNPQGTTMGYAQDSTGSSSWQQQSPSHSSLQATPTSELQQFHLRDQQVLHRSMSQQPPFPSPHSAPQFQRRSTLDSSAISAQTATSPNVGDETPILSPSSFFLQQVEIPGCNDLTGACRCGDGCQCVGCLTHGGHDGVPLEQSTAPSDTHDTCLTFSSGSTYHLQSQPGYGAAQSSCCGGAG